MDLQELIDAFADAVADKVTAKLKEEQDRPPVPLKEAAKMLSKSREHLRNEVNAGRVKRVPGTSRVLIPFPEIKRLQAGEAISKV